MHEILFIARDTILGHVRRNLAKKSSRHCVTICRKCEGISSQFGNVFKTATGVSRQYAFCVRKTVNRGTDVLSISELVWRVDTVIDVAAPNNHSL